MSNCQVNCQNCLREECEEKEVVEPFQDTTDEYENE